MSALDELKTAFALPVRSRGKVYFLDNQVELLRAEPGLLKARVQGTREYRIEVRWSELGIGYACTCASFQDENQPCRHIWAALLEADHEGNLEVASGRIGATIIRPAVNGHAKRLPLWKQQIQRLRQRLTEDEPAAEESRAWPADRQIIYGVEVAQTRSRDDGSVVMRLMTRRVGRGGKFSEPKRFAFSLGQWLAVPDEPDRTIARALGGVRRAPVLPVRGPMPPPSVNGHRSVSDSVDSMVDLAPWAWPETMKAIVSSGRCYLVDENRIVGEPLAWDDQSWSFEVDVRGDPLASGHRITGCLRRGDESISLANVDVALREGWAIVKGRVARVHTWGAGDLLVELLRHDDMIVPSGATGEVLDELLRLPKLPPVRLAESFGVRTESERARPVLRVGAVDHSSPFGPAMLRVEPWFFYASVSAQACDGRAVIFDGAGSRLVLRDLPAEGALLAVLASLGVRRDRESFFLSSERLGRVVPELIAGGWRVEAEGRAFRSPGQIEARVRSGIDWFDIEASVDFGGTRAALPALLSALRKGERMIVLGDGTVGLLPDEWLNRYAAILDVGESLDDGQVRFKKTQAALLDAMLATMPDADIDETFRNARAELASFSGIQSGDPPESFTGTLREYQREGLGWLTFLQRFGFGGCLADDMGLGKTVQVLALLEARRHAKEGTSLVVVPRSLLFNWVAEAQRFTPAIRVLEHTGMNRATEPAGFGQFDLIVTTYGTMRRDIHMLREFEFDYVVLDESQAIKNASTASAKAVRLLHARHKLAMSGTPIENHLGELWSLFEFLNPGMLGASSAFRTAKGQAELPQTAREMLSRAVRPFILRRTKSQVAKELPERVEQTVICELDDDQRKMYDDLKAHYRRSLVEGTTDPVGSNSARVLEALLRLRQCACHPALIDSRLANRPAAKFDALLRQLTELVEGGHKALVFSQFVRLLQLLKSRLEHRQIAHTYLDGKTRDRRAVVEQFQNDPTCPIMLVSLKAGGVGLNLTAAEYVFLLDPWWNPAVEAQAIDRAHRIGQTRAVFAYRLIARDTVEEKVLQLQQKKKDLAMSVITDKNALPGYLTKDDLMSLLM
jgi:superfamily II DNA or RNA helicase